MSIGARVKAIMVGMVLLKTKLTMALTKLIEQLKSTYLIALVLRPLPQLFRLSRRLHSDQPLVTHWKLSHG